MSDTQMNLYKVQVRVGNAWVPAHQGTRSKGDAERLRKLYAEQRPQAQVRVVQAQS